MGGEGLTVAGMAEEMVVLVGVVAGESAAELGVVMGSCRVRVGKVGVDASESVVTGMDCQTEKQQYPMMAITGKLPLRIIHQSPNKA